MLLVWTSCLKQSLGAHLLNLLFCEHFEVSQLVEPRYDRYEGEYDEEDHVACLVLRGRADASHDEDD